MNHLNRPLEVKSIDELQGVFEGYGNVFGVEDHYRDVVEPGAFAASLDRWRGKGAFRRWKRRVISGIVPPCPFRDYRALP